MTDLASETVTFTVIADGVTLTQKPAIQFITPPAASAGISGTPATVSADGTSNATITVTLQDSLGRPTPDKLVTLFQGSGRSVISGPISGRTDSGGQIEFGVTDTHSETVTYTATDVTDGNLPVPGSAMVAFQNGSGCAGGSPTAAPGFAVNAFATGFTATTFNTGNINFGCSGAMGLAFDPSGNLYVAHAPTGTIYKFPPTGGVADASTLITSTPLGAGTMGLAFDGSGNLFAARAATSGDFTTGDVVQVNPSTGAIIREVSTGLVCPFTLSTDPVSGDLFTGDGCTGAGSDRTDIWRISNPGGAVPTTSTYVNTPGQDNFGITFAPDGTLYVNTRDFRVARITGTADPQPPTVSLLPTTVTWGNLGIAAAGMQSSGDAQFLLLNSPSVAPKALQTFDLTNNSPGVLVASALGALDTKVIGPDGCLYSAAGLAVYKFGNADGTCNFGPDTEPPTLSLAPSTVSPNPTQGSSQSFTATFHHATAPAGTSVKLIVSGANSQIRQASADQNGQASFAYSGSFSGQDTVVASAEMNGATVSSSPTTVTWDAGPHATFLSLNASPKSGTPGQPVTVVGSLADVSVNPFAPVSGESIMFELGNSSCSAMTDANGNASCPVTPNQPGMGTLAAHFSGTQQLVASDATTGFNTVVQVTPVPTFTSVPTGRRRPTRPCRPIPRYPRTLRYRRRRPHRRAPRGRLAHRRRFLRPRRHPGRAPHARRAKDTGKITHTSGQ